MYIIVNERVRRKVDVRSKKVEEFLRELGFNPATTVVMVNGKILTEEDRIKGEEVHIYTAESYG